MTTSIIRIKQIIFNTEQLILLQNNQHNLKIRFEIFIILIINIDNNLQKSGVFMLIAKTTSVSCEDCFSV